MMSSPGEPLVDVDRRELEEQIAELEEELDDLAMERRMTLGGTGVHIGAAEAERMRNEFERDEARVNARLAELRGRLSTASSR